MESFGDSKNVAADCLAEALELVQATFLVDRAVRNNVADPRPDHTQLPSVYEIQRTTI